MYNWIHIEALACIALYNLIYIEDLTCVLVYMYKCDKYQNVMYSPICMQMYIIQSLLMKYVCIRTYKPRKSDKMYR